jgi:archaellum component FlaC
MSIKLMMEIERAHELLEKLDERLGKVEIARIVEPQGYEILPRLEKLENEIKAMKARADKNKELAEI